MRPVSSHFWSVRRTPKGQIERCTIDAPNVSSVIRHEGIPPCDIMVVSVDSGFSTLADCPREAFAQVGKLAFASRRPIAIPDAVRDWMAGLPVDIIAFNKEGFLSHDLAELCQDERFKDKLAIGTSQGIGKGS